MGTLLDKIKYDHKHYSELTDRTGRQEIEELAVKLTPLENEIVKHPDGDIDIMTSGNIFTTCFPEDLAGQITKLVTGLSD